MSTVLKTPRNLGLDILRGVAILLVLFNHVEPSTLPGLPAVSGLFGAAYWRFRSLGWSGLNLFFVLSGFLISGLLFKELERTGTLELRRFWVRRAFKIIPPYAVLLIVLAATGATRWLDTTSASTVAVSLAQHGLFFQNYIAFNANGPTWSLAVEEHFYLVLPSLLLLLSIKATPAQFERRLLVAGFIVLVGVLGLRCFHALHHGVEPDDYRLTHFQFDGLFLGVLVQLIARRKHAVAQAILRRPQITLGVAAVLVAPSLFLGRAHPLMFSVGFTSLGLGYALVLLIFAKGLGLRAPGRLGRGLALVGGWSYSIYLWNYFLAKLPLTGFLMKQTWNIDPVQHPAMSILVRGSVFVVTAVVVGGVLTKLVETPFLWLREKLTNPAPREALSTTLSPAVAVPV